MALAFVERICNHFENVTDPRVNRGTNYPLIEMVFVALCGAICDCNAWTDVAEFGEAKLAWFCKFLPFEKGIPSPRHVHPRYLRDSTPSSFMPRWNLGRERWRAR